ncbi:hypothetical protein [Nesterenkonia muleiensis]|nr:hypothetical protein [Nesterenkonia muleiensis]
MIVVIDQAELLDDQAYGHISTVLERWCGLRFIPPAAHGQFLMVA